MLLLPELEYYTITNKSSFENILVVFNLAVN